MPIRESAAGVKLSKTWYKPSFGKRRESAQAFCESMLGTTYYFLVRSPHWFAGCLRRAGDGLSPLAACDARRLRTNLFLRSVDDLPAALRFAVLNGFLQFKLLAWVLIAEIRPAGQGAVPVFAKPPSVRSPRRRREPAQRTPARPRRPA